MLYWNIVNNQNVKINFDQNLDHAPIMVTLVTYYIFQLLDLKL